MSDTQIISTEDKKTLSRQRLEAFNDYRSLISNIKGHAFTFLEIGRLLKKIRDNEEYKYLGEGGFGSFREFLNNSEIGIREPSSLYLYIDAYETYIERLGMTPDEVLGVALTRLQRMLPSVKKTINEDNTKINATKEMVLSMGAMTTTDFDKTAREQKIIADRPRLFIDKDTGKWVLECFSEDINRIVVKYRDRDEKELAKEMNAKLAYLDIKSFEESND